MKKILKTVLGLCLAFSFAFVPSVMNSNDNTSSITTVSANSGEVWTKVGEIEFPPMKVTNKKTGKTEYKIPISYQYKVYYYGKFIGYKYRFGRWK